MTIATELQRIIDAKAAIKAAIIEKGVDVPDTEKLDVYHEYIDQITGGGGSWNPDNPTLEGLIDAVKKGMIPEDGIEIPDTYDGNNSPLIVAQVLDGSPSAYKDASGKDAKGVVLIRKFVEPTSQTFGSSVRYNESAVFDMLNGTYYNNCSEMLRSAISDISVPYYDGSSINTVTGLWHIPSGIEVGATYNDGEGVFWELFKQITGLSSASNSSVRGRIFNNRAGAAKNYWLRSRMSGSYVGYVNGATGNIITSAAPTVSNGVLPFCFISSSK